MTSHHDTSASPYPLADAARLLLEAGLSVIPIRDLAAKAPAVSTWMPYRQAPATALVAQRWFADNGHPGAPGLAIIAGHVSGGLTVLDFDVYAGESRYDAFAAEVEESAPGLLARLPLVATPSGGRHLYFRCAGEVAGNERLAETAAHQVLIETRGEGGYVVAPPTPGYAILRGTVRAVPAITADERAMLLQTARTLGGRAPTPEGAAHTTAAAGRPGDAYNAQRDAGQLAALLADHGWTIVGVSAGRIRLRRPGKDAGISATITADQGMAVFYPFTSSTQFEPSRGYSPFGVYAQLHHGGDYGAAAAALAARGYGQPSGAAAPDPRPPAPQPRPAAAPPPAEAFNWRDHVRPLTDLMARVFPPAVFVVPGVIPAGVTLIAGAPKTGKSLLGWQIALAKARGGYALGKMQVAAGDVLYLCLEDGERLAQKRVARMLEGAAPPASLAYSTAWRPLLAGGIDDLREYLAERPATSLVVIDTYEPLRAPDKPGSNAYRNDYAGLRPLTQLSHELGRDIIVIHHTSKMERPDPLATVNGSYALNGAVDNVMILSRVRFGSEVLLSISGRDLDEDLQLALSFNPATCSHTLLGDAAEVGRTKLQGLILSVLRRSRGPLQAREIADELGKPNDSSLRHLLGKLVSQGMALVVGRGRYKAAPKGGAPHADDCTCDRCDRCDQWAEPTPIRPFCDLAQGEEGEGEPGEPQDVIGAIDHNDHNDHKLYGKTPCPGCGSRASWGPAPYAPELIICRRCGVTHPEQEEEHDDDA